MQTKTITAPIRKTLQRVGLWPRRESFLRIFPRNAVCAELGVFQGVFSQKIIEVTQPQKIHLIDPWWTVIGETYGDWSRKHNHGNLLSTREAFEQAKSNVAQVDAHGVAEFHVEDDLQCLAGFPDHYFDWVYVDSTHLYEHTKAELELLQRKVKPQGLIAGHDWHPDPGHIHHGVCRAVLEFCDQYGWRIKKIDKRYTQWCIERIPV